MGLMERLIAQRRHRWARELMLLYGLEIPAGVVVGRDLKLQHRAMGTVITPNTTLGDRVSLYHQVTIGRVDGHVPIAESPFVGVEVGDDAVLFPGCKVLGGAGVTRVGRGTIVGANAVLTQSTNDWEIWGGVPARKIGNRPRPNPR